MEMLTLSQKEYFLLQENFTSLSDLVDKEEFGKRLIQILRIFAPNSQH